MSQHELLRLCFEQHKAKNNYSKIDDNNNDIASEEVVNILNETYQNVHTFTHKKHLYLTEIEDYLGCKFELPYNYENRKLSPDGGVIWMDNKYPIVISESKRQGTNLEREAAGLPRQATGNAIERLGKNLIGIEKLYERDKIMPFVVFCWGCDFADNQPTVLTKLYTLNSFYAINTIYLLSNIPKTCGNKPFTCLTNAYHPFSLEEMIDIILKIAEDAILYFEEKEEIISELFR